MHNMLIRLDAVVAGRWWETVVMHFNPELGSLACRPSEDELSAFGTPDFTIYNAGAFPANRYT